MTTGTKSVAPVFSHWVRQPEGNLGGGRFSVVPQRWAIAAALARLTIAHFFRSSLVEK